MLQCVNIAELELYFFTKIRVSDGMTNLALRRPAYQSSTFPGSSAARAVDGNADPDYGHNHCSSTQDPPGGPNWLVVDLEDFYLVNFVVVTNRNDCCRKFNYTQSRCIGRGPGQISLYVPHRD